MIEVILGDNKYELTSPKLKQWVLSEEKLHKARQAAERKDTNELSDLICSYVSVACSAPVDDLPWFEVATAFTEYRMLCLPDHEFAILFGKEINEPEIPWDYEGRIWYFYLHVIAGAYNWSKEDIENLDFNDGIGVIQEILISEQLEKEWQWGLSEVAYEYEKATKKSKLRPYPRPSWMKSRKPIAPPKPVKILKSMLPVGNVIQMTNEATKFEKRPEIT